MGRQVTWVAFSKQTRRNLEVYDGDYAFIGSAVIGAVYTFYENDTWYGTFAGSKIGSCRTAENAMKLVEQRWSLCDP